MARSTVALTLALFVLLGAIQADPASAQEIQVLVDGQPVTFDQPPLIIGGRVLVPLRGVFERLGASVQWDPQSSTVIAVRDQTRVELRIGSRDASVSGRPILLDVPPMIVQARTLIPLRFVSEAMGARVDWDSSTRTVFITSPTGTPTQVHEVSGRLTSLSGQTIILAGGQSYGLADGARFFIDGREVSRESIRAGMEVTLRIDSQTNRVLEVVARGQVSPIPGSPFLARDVPPGGVAAQLPPVLPGIRIVSCAPPPNRNQEPRVHIICPGTKTHATIFFIRYEGFVPNAQAEVIVWNSEFVVTPGVVWQRGELFQTTPEGTGQRHWVVYPSDPVGKYDAVVRQGGMKASTTFTVNLASSPRILVVPGKMLPGCVMFGVTDAPFVSMSLDPSWRCPPGAAWRVLLAGFAPQQVVRVRLYRSEGSSWKYNTSLKPVQTDKNGTADFSIRSSPDDPSGNYRVVTEPRTGGFFDGGFSLGP